MKRKSIKAYLLILAALMLLMSLPKRSNEKLQGTTVAAFASAWEQIESIKQGAGIAPSKEREELIHLELENQLLRSELDQLKELLNLEITPSTRSLPARVIFRSPSSWGSSLWINVGEANNQNETVIIKNSPVMYGTSVVGVVDYVGKHQSRVRLITDSGLTPSVRAVREHEGMLRYLAKGELSGSIQTKWRSQSQTLKGVGFNYDFPDDYGPARDLRTGEALEANKQFPTLPIIEPGDLLITTGMDGIFPPDLHVATVTEVNLLKEGDYTFTIEATPTAKNLDELSLLFVIPPLGFDPRDVAPHVGR